MNEDIDTCRTCKQSKPISSFKKELRCKKGYTPHCKECINKQKRIYRYINHSHYLKLEKKRRNRKDVKEYLKKWWVEHREEQHEKAKRRYENNPLPYLERSKLQREKNPVRYKAYLKKWRKENAKWSRDYYHNVNKKNINWKIKNTLRGSLRKALNGSNKTCSVLKYLGCSLGDFKEYMKSQFYGTMSWENYGSVWHIDHIIPCRSFDMTREDERRKCFHYTNLQPLTVEDNCSKQDKLPNGMFARKLLTSSEKPV